MLSQKSPTRAQTFVWLFFFLFLFFCLLLSDEPLWCHDDAYSLILIFNELKAVFISQSVHLLLGFGQKHLFLCLTLSISHIEKKKKLDLQFVSVVLKTQLSVKTWASMENMLW